MTSDEFTEQLDENLHKWFKEKWVRFGPDGKIRGACARGDDSEGKPKCLPQKKAQNLGKKGRKYAASKKRREDPNPERTGKAKNVATKKKTNEDIPFNECPSCRGPIVHESMLNEKQDACYHKVKSRYKVWPSAYASGALVQCRKKGASNWGTGGKKSESSIMKGIVDEASGTPGGLERYRTPAMVNATMQQSLYKRELAPIKAAEKKRKEAEYRKNNPSVSVPSIQIGASTYPIHIIHNWIGSKDLNAAVEFAVNKFAYRQSKDFKTEIAGDPDFQKAVKNFFNVAEKSLNHRDSTRTKSHWDGKIRAAPRETDTSSDGFDAINKINDALLPYYKKYGVDKTGRRVPPNFNYALGEAKAKQYVKPYNDPQTGEQIGWVSSDGYHKKYWQKFAKNSAIKHAKLNPDEVDEDYTGQFAAEKTPAINPYGGLKDNKFRGAISEEPTDNPTGASGEGGWRKYKPKSAGTLEEEQLDEGLTQKIGAAAMAAALAFGGAKAQAEPVYVYSTSDGAYKTVLSPEEIPANAARKLIVDTDNDSVSIIGKTGNIIPVELDPVSVRNIKQRAGIGQAKPVQPKSQISANTTSPEVKSALLSVANKMKDPESAIFSDLTQYYFDDGTSLIVGTVNAKNSYGGYAGGDMFISTPTGLKNIGYSGKAGLLGPGYWNKDNPSLKLLSNPGANIIGDNSSDFITQELQNYIALYTDEQERNKFNQKNIKKGKQITNAPKLVKTVKLNTLKYSALDEDTSYAGGMGQGGNAGESYRKFKPKSAGTFKEAAGQKYEVRFANGKTQRFVAVSPEEAKKKAKGLGASSLIKINKDGMPKGKVEEEQLDEKCWDTHKQVGMKNKGGKQVPNCVPKESAILKGILGRD